MRITFKEGRVSASPQIPLLEELVHGVEYGRILRVLSRLQKLARVYALDCNGFPRKSVYSPGFNQSCFGNKVAKPTPYLNAEMTLFFDKRISTISSLALDILFNMSKANW